jgi:hypothetical protein
LTFGGYRHGTIQMMNETQVARWGHIRSRGIARFLTPVAVGWTLLQAGGRLLFNVLDDQPIVWLAFMRFVGFQGLGGFLFAYGLWWFYDRQWLKATGKKTSVTDSQS